MPAVPRWSWFQDAWWPKRLVALLVLLAASAGVLRMLARLIDFPPDFNDAQSASANELLRHPDRWSIWSKTAKRDLVLFIPAYVSWGVTAIAWATWRRPLSSWSCGFMLAGGAVDVVETVLFRRTLDRLMHGASESQLSTLTSVTATATKVKWACAALAIVLLIAGVLLPPRRRARAASG